MKRREFSAAAAAALAVGTGYGTPALAQARRPEPGWDYLALRKPVPVEAPAGKIEVVEFVWYSCRFCNAFEPMLEGWSKRLPGDVVVRRVPVGFRDEFVPQQRLFYTLRAMGQLERLHARVFAAIHSERLDLARGQAIVDWVGQNGVDKARFAERFASPEIQELVGKATQLQDAYGVEGVPALGVAGRFYTDGSIATTMERALQVVDFLLAEVRSGR
ncbi:MAG: thiol:disulfide interchange protein DsbA/DsbL [Hyphomicrobiales bacterium]|nr:thiol:disulfide interchange protein DsbA/DsbL [Hyphomicrobiales bacterium]